MRINKSVSRAIEILQLISQNRNPLTIADISKSLRIPKSSTFEILHTLLEKDIVEVENQNSKAFTLGLKLFEITLLALGKTDLHREARPMLEDLMYQTGETVFLAVEDGGEMVYLGKEEGPSMIRATAHLGSRMPMYCTGLGKALLAAYPEDRIREITGGGRLAPLTRNTIKHYDDLIKELDSIRRRGYSIDNQECILDVFCVAAPIYDQTETPVAAISIASQASKMDKEKLEKFAKLVPNAALNISRRLGFRGEKLFL